VLISFLLTRNSMTIHNTYKPMNTVSQLNAPFLHTPIALLDLATITAMIPEDKISHITNGL
jgi:hypothetical protein